MSEEKYRNTVDSSDNVSPDVKETQAAAQPDLSSVLGVVTALMMDSPVHEYFLLSDTKWLVDLVAPFGGAEEVMKDLKRTVFEGKTVKSRQVAPDGAGRAVVEW